jgi:hypothetical protein
VAEEVAVGRLPGWIAHWREMHDKGGEKIGPRQIYTGHGERDYVTIDARSVAAGDLTAAPPGHALEPPSPTAPRVSSQDAVLFLLKSEAGREAILQWRNGRVGFADLPLLADSIGSVEASISLQWIDDLPHPVLSGAADAAVLVVDREFWLDRIQRFPELDRPFPDDLVVAAVIDVPSADRCLVVPTGGRQSGDTVMLYAEERSGEDRLLVPVAVARGSAEAVRLPQPCQLSPTVDCVKSGCSGTCQPRQNRQRGELVTVGCICM